uniref:TLDc domain-containing protein n=1 Tax=Rhizophora mucronata TaxID=61149 RepID=A0A2P2KG28_RHIMU
MGASSSTEQKVSSERREVEGLAASTGAIRTLQSAFSKLADPQLNAIPLHSLQKCFCLSYKNPVCESPGLPDYFTPLLSHLGQSLVDQFFVLDKGGVSWVEFVKGYLKCCGRMPASLSLNALLRVVALAAARAGTRLGLEFESDDNDCKISGSFLPSDVLVVFWICWTMLWDSKTSTLSKGNKNLYLANVSHLVLSAVVSCAEDGNSLNLWDCDFLGFDVQLPAGKFLTWVFATVPGLSDCLMQFVNARLEKLITHEVCSYDKSMGISVFLRKVLYMQFSFVCLLNTQFCTRWEFYYPIRGNTLYVL